MTKKVLRYTLTLLDDLVLSHRNATTGEHQSLRHIPGSAIRGWVASRLYDTLSHADAWKVFHGGQLRFGDARPLADDGQVTWPTPLSWHTNKADPDGGAIDAGRWHGERIFNLAADEPSSGLPDPFQPRGLRSGWVLPDGRAFESRIEQRTMTAIGEQGRAAESQLFRYQSLAVGQRFAGELRADQGLDEALLEALQRALSGATMRIGRSRNTHYGRVAVQPAAWENWQAPTFSLEGSSLRLLLLSDANVSDEHGQPTLAPDTSAMRVTSLRFDAAKSFVRTRRYSPWNAKRGMPELERQVLCAGSVLAFDSGQSIATSALEYLAWAGIGDARESGLGEVAVAPSLLNDWHPQPAVTSTPQLNSANTGLSSQGQQIDEPVPTALVLWLKAASGRASHSDDAQAWARTAARALAEAWLALRRFHGVPPMQEHGPVGTQWGRLSELAATAGSAVDCRKRIFGVPDEKVPERDVGGAINTGDADWDAGSCRFILGNEVRSLRLALRTHFDTAIERFPGDEAAALDALQRLLDRVRRERWWAAEQVLVQAMRSTTETRRQA